MKRNTRLITLMLVLMLLLSTASVFAAPVPASHKVLLGKTPLNDLEGYLIKEENYFKLRDLAKALKGTEKQFGVSYDEKDQTVVLEREKVYAPTGTEGEKTPPTEPVASHHKVKLDGKEINLTGYLVGGYNYYRLRDVAKALDFGVSFDEKTRTVTLDVKVPYVEEAKGLRTLKENNWAPATYKALSKLIAENGKASPSYNEKEKPYAVFDFDNTSVINDVQEALLIYQLENLIFKIKPEEMTAVLETGIPDVNQKFDKEYNELTVAMLAEDITKAYTWIYENYKGLNPKGTMDLKEIQKTPEYQEFVTKVRFMYDAVNDTFDASVGYPWVTYLFTGMTPQEVRSLATESHKYWTNFGKFEKVKWESPDIESKCGKVSVSYKTGITVPKELNDLYNTLMENGIDVYVCSASFIDVIKAIAVGDAFGYNVPEDRVYAMMLKLDENGRYKNEYDTDYFQTQGPGKSETIKKFILPKYNGRGPILVAGDSQGDYNMMTDFKDTKLLLLFNRYRKDDTKKLAQEAVSEMGKPDAHVVLQGRDENKGQLRPSEKTILLGEKEEVLVRE